MLRGFLIFIKKYIIIFIENKERVIFNDEMSKDWSRL